MIEKLGERFLSSLKSLGQVFLAATGLIWLFNVAALLKDGDAWLGLLYLLILLIPTSSIAILKLKAPRANAASDDSLK